MDYIADIVRLQAALTDALGAFRDGQKAYLAFLACEQAEAAALRAEIKRLLADLRGGGA